MARLGRQYEVGDRIWEDAGVSGKWSAGRIVAIVEAEERPERVYMLLRANNGTETIYTCLKDCVCEPSLPRFMPCGVVEALGRIGAECELTPDDVDESPGPRKKRKKKVSAPKREFYKPPEDEDLSDIDEDLSDIDEDPEPVVESGGSIQSGRILPVVDLPKSP